MRRQMLYGTRPRLGTMFGREATLFRPIEGSDRLVCTACARYCKVGQGQIGFCGVRQNVGGKLYLLVYGRVIAGHVDPIEKKPVTHYRPGSKIFSIATTGCSWACQYCQNADISQRRKPEGLEATPAEVAAMAARYRAEGIAYTYNEPSIFMEYAHDIGREAHARGIFNIFVSNGYDTPDGVAVMKDFLDCITVDFKGSGETNFVRRYIGISNAQPVFETLNELKSKTNIHVEITDLIVPEVGDNLDEARKLSKFVYDLFGPDMPIHFLRWHPDYKMMDLPMTPIPTLEKHCQVAREEGLKFVYIGNVPGHPLEHTYCPGCGGIAVNRYGFDIRGWHLDKDNRCKACGYPIPIVGPLANSIKEDRFRPVIW